MIRTALVSLAVALGSIVVNIAPAQAASDWTIVSAGGSHTCGIRAGELYCWGYNAFGQVGSDTSGANVLTPTRITTANDWKTVTTGISHTCAIRSVGKLYCWGQNGAHEVGIDSGGANVLTPKRITSAEDWKTVSAGDYHTCAIRSVGKLYCWGANTHDQVGFNTNQANVPTPTTITTADDWKSVSGGGDHTCAIRSIGKLYCWGNNFYDEVGFNTNQANVPTPTKITSADDWKSADAGGGYTCAIRSIGKLYCWGSNYSDQVGYDSNMANVPTPTKITSADDWKSVTAGGSTCAIRSVGKLYCWGYNATDQVGFDSNKANVSTPTKITSADDWKTVTQGASHACAIRSIGRLYCWGNNPDGQASSGPNPVPTPTEVGNPSSALSVTKHA